MIYITKKIIDGYKNNINNYLNNLENGTYCIVKNEDIFYFIYNLINNKLIKNNIYNSKSILNKLIKNLVKHKKDLILYKCINYEVEQYHHTSLWGVLKIADKPTFIIDIYYIHELIHISNITYFKKSDINFNTWKKRIIYEEFFASAYTESIIYFDIDNLRNETKIELDKNILVDLLLNNSILLSEKIISNKELFNNDKILFINKIIDYYLKKIFEYPTNEEDYYIISFRLNNLIWLEIWKKNYKFINKIIYKFYNLYSNKYIKYINKISKKNIDKIIFSEEAHIFYSYVQSRIKSEKNLILFIDTQNENEQIFVSKLKNEYGIIKSVVLSPTNEILRVIKNLKKNNETIYLQKETFLSWQDFYGEHFVNLTKKFLKNISNDIDLFKHGYIFSGTNEAHNKMLMLVKRENVTLHLFKSDYEGYHILAKDYDIKFILHDRNNITESLNLMNENDYFWFSNPSSTNGCFLENYDEIMNILNNKKVKVYIDMIYIGTVNKKIYINLNYNCIYAISWSCSKSFPGMFYYRIGVLLSKIDLKEFNSSSWFYNLESIRLGIELLTKYNTFDLPNKYLKYQKKSCQIISKLFNFNLKCSDCVWILYNIKEDETINKELNHFYRPLSKILRFNISEFILRMVDTNNNNNYLFFKNFNQINFIKDIIN